MSETFDIKQFDAALRSIADKEDLRVPAREVCASRAFLEFIRGACLESYQPVSEGRIDAVLASAFHIGFAVGCTYTEVKRLEEMVK